MHVDKANKHNTLFHATYLSMVLDHFANELPGITEGVESHVARHGGGRKLSCIDGINATIYYRKKFPQ